MKRVEELGISPAPWRANKALYTNEVLSADGVVCETVRCDPNARLIAAAPKLYEALRKLAEYLSLNEWQDRELAPYIDEADVALAAAGGEEEK